MAIRRPALATASPQSAYVHVPFCAHRCGYCNFTLVAGRNDLVEPYLTAIETELGWLGGPHPVTTLFLGGGTPTQLAPPQLARLCRIVSDCFALSDDCEFSVEANPADLTADHVAVLADFGVTRLSLGVQSFQPAKLAVLERDHRAADIERSVAIARKRLSAVSLDLIFAAPGETLAGWADDLRRAVALAPEHVSTYGLTYERGARFYALRKRGELPAVDEETELAMYTLAIDTLVAAGFEHYEVSNFAQPGRRSRHNETYWLGESYYAAGPGASRYVAGCRETNHRSTFTYLKRVLAGQSPVAEREVLADADRAREQLVFGLRRLDGIDRTGFAQRSGFDLESLAGDKLRKYVARGWLVDEHDRIRLSRAGLVISDSLWPELLVPD